MKNFFLWFRHLGWMYLVVIIVLSIVGYGAYTLALAAPLIKLSFALGGIMAYNLIIKTVKPLSPTLIYTVLLIMPIAIYSLILSAFIVPWPITGLIFFNLFLAIILVVMDEKKTKIPKTLIWAKEITYAVTLVYLAYLILILI